MTSHDKKWLLLDDEESKRNITIILAAYGEHFPQLRGKAVRPDLRDTARTAFASELVRRLRQGGVRFFREAKEDPITGNSKWFAPKKD